MSNNEYQRKYQLSRYRARRKEILAKLGGKCVECGAKNKLEIDHIDPNEKEFSISDFWAARPEIMNAELAKCQILCCKCHKKKHSVKGKHGTLSTYRYCRCELCRAANARHSREYKRKKSAHP